jgi:hypothetical protein
MSLSVRLGIKKTKRLAMCYGSNPIPWRLIAYSKRWLPFEFHWGENRKIKIPLKYYKRFLKIILKIIENLRNLRTKKNYTLKMYKYPYSLRTLLIKIDCYKNEISLSSIDSFQQVV